MRNEQVVFATLRTSRKQKEHTEANCMQYTETLFNRVALCPILQSWDGFLPDSG